MKKILLFILLVMTGLTFVGCGKTTVTKETDVTTLMTSLNTTSAETTSETTTIVSSTIKAGEVIEIVYTDFLSTYGETATELPSFSKPYISYANIMTSSSTNYFQLSTKRTERNAGYIYNTIAFSSDILSIEVFRAPSKVGSKTKFYIYASDNLISDVSSLIPVADNIFWDSNDENLSYKIDLSSYNYSYFYFLEGANAGYYSSIKIILK